MLKCPRCGWIGRCPCFPMEQPRVSHDMRLLSTPESLAYADAYLRAFQSVIANSPAYGAR